MQDLYLHPCGKNYYLRFGLHYLVNFRERNTCYCSEAFPYILSWQGLGTMPSIEAMRLFVKILEVTDREVYSYLFKRLTWSIGLISSLLLIFYQEEDPGWYSRASNDIPDPVVDVQINVSFCILWDSMSNPWKILHISFAWLKKSIQIF